MVTIEPIKNQYLTALKERQQIIDKLNEIISGLNALNFDDLTTIQSELVAIRESLQTQNTAITEINNSIGQIETELTSFDNRLITLNTNIEDTKSNLNSFENDTALNLQSKVNKNGDTMTGNLGIPTTATGSKDNFAVNGTRLQNDLDNYSLMARLTNNQNFTGNNSFSNTIYRVTEKNEYAFSHQRLSFDIENPPSTGYLNIFKCVDKNFTNLVTGEMRFYNDGTTRFIINVRNSDGTYKAVTVATGDVKQ